MTTHVVQFTNLADFIHDLDQADAVGGIYHQLIEQRTATFSHGLTRWLLTTVIRAVAIQAGTPYTAALTFGHGPQVDHLNGAPFDPLHDSAARWREAREAHDAIIGELNYLCAIIGLFNLIRAGVVAVPSDLSLLLATFAKTTEEAPAPQD